MVFSIEKKHWYICFESVQVLEGILFRKNGRVMERLKVGYNVSILPKRAITVNLQVRKYKYSFTVMMMAVAVVVVVGVEQLAILLLPVVW